MPLSIEREREGDIDTDRRIHGCMGFMSLCLCVCRYGRVDVWVRETGRHRRRVHGCMDSVYGCIYGWIYGCMNLCMESRMHVCIYLCTYACAPVGKYV